MSESMLVQIVSSHLKNDIYPWRMTKAECGIALHSKSIYCYTSIAIVLDSSDSPWMGDLNFSSIKFVIGTVDPSLGCHQM